MISTTKSQDDLADDMTHLTAKQVFAHFEWRKSKGYLMLKLPGFPPGIGGKFRFDTIREWEQRVLVGELPGDRQQVASFPELLPSEDATVDREPVTAAPVAAELPKRSRTRGLNRKVAA